MKAMTMDIRRKAAVIKGSVVNKVAEGSKAFYAKRVDKVAMGRATDEELLWVASFCKRNGLESEFYMISA